MTDAKRLPLLLAFPLTAALALGLAAPEPAAAQGADCYRGRSHATGERVWICRDARGEWVVTPESHRRVIEAPRPLPPSVRPGSGLAYRRDRLPDAAPEAPRPRALAPATPPAPAPAAGAEVRRENRRLQAALNLIGCPAGALDGEWGAASRRAARCFQRSIGARATGQLTTDQADWLIEIATRQGGDGRLAALAEAEAAARIPEDAAPSAGREAEDQNVENAKPDDARAPAANTPSAPQAAAQPGAPRANGPLARERTQVETPAPPSDSAEPRLITPAPRVALPRLPAPPEALAPSGPERDAPTAGSPDLAGSREPDRLATPRLGAPAHRVAPGWNAGEGAASPPLDTDDRRSASELVLPRILAEPPQRPGYEGADESDTLVAQERARADDPVGLPDLRIDVRRERAAAPDAAGICDNARDESCGAEALEEERDSTEAVAEIWAAERRRIAEATGGAAPSVADKGTEDIARLAPNTAQPDRARRAPAGESQEEIARLAQILGLQPAELSDACRKGMAVRQSEKAPWTGLFNRVCRAHAYAVGDEMLKLGYDARLAAAGDAEAKAAMAARRAAREARRDGEAAKD